MEGGKDAVEDVAGGRSRRDVHLLKGQEAFAGRMLLKARENGAKQCHQSAHKGLQQLMYLP